MRTLMKVRSGWHSKRVANSETKIGVERWQETNSWNLDGFCWEMDGEDRQTLDVRLCRDYIYEEKHNWGMSTHFR